MSDIVSTGTLKATPAGNSAIVYELDYSILPKYAAWAAETDYAIGARVTRSSTGRFYGALVGGVDATAPEDALEGETPKWEDLGPTPADVYLTPDVQFYSFAGHASLQIVPSAGTVTVQLQSDNSGSSSNFAAGYNTAGTVHPAICTDLATSKFFEEISVPFAAHTRLKFSNSSATVASTGKAYLYINHGS